MIDNYNLLLCILIIALITSLITFGFTWSTYRSHPQFAKLWLSLSALAAGTSVWVCQFIFIMILSSRWQNFDTKYLIVSWLLMSLASCLTLTINYFNKLIPRLFITDAVLFSSLFSALDYFSMYTLQLSANSAYAPGLILLLIAIFIALSTLLLLIFLWMYKNHVTWYSMPAILAFGLASTIAICSYYLVTLKSLSPSFNYMNLTSSNTVLFASAITLIAMALIVIAFIFSIAKNRQHRNGSPWNNFLNTSPQELNRMASLDALTQLPNRRLFRQQLDGAIARANRSGNSLAVVFIDLDGFKPINDKHGHDIGDKVLLAVSDRLRDAIRGFDVVARMGGDEFVALLNEIKSNEDIVPVVERIVQSLGDEYYIDGHEIAISASVGIAVYPRDGDVEMLLVRADTAMYGAKKNGKNQFRFFDDEIELSSDRLRELQRDLKLALTKNEFELCFQPKFDCKTNLIEGFEAFIRWNHPTMGTILPNVFIPVAERMGMIPGIGEWVIEESCCIMRALLDQGISTKIAINLSPYQLKNPHLVKIISSILTRFALPSHSLIFEITEGVDLHKSHELTKILSCFELADLEISINNFGCGISSISYLQNINADEIKLSPHFTKDVGFNIQTQAIVSSVIKLAHALLFRVVAEGVETDSQRKMLIELGCDQIQGNLLGRPVLKEKLLSLIREQEMQSK